MSHIVSIIILAGKEFDIGVQAYDQANHKVPSLRVSILSTD